MKIKSTIFALFVLFMTSCSKETIEPIVEPTPMANSSAAAHFYENVAYYELFIYRFDEVAGKWSNRIRAHFPAVSENDPTYLGFRQLYVENSGVNLFQMVTIYKDLLPSTNLKTAGINADKVLRFFPSEQEANGVASTGGTVEVAPQQIKIYTKGDIEERDKMEYIEIGISGEGTYDLTTGVIDLNVHFDETKVGGPSKVTRKYKMSKTELKF